MTDTFTQDANPRAVIGGNRPPLAKLISGEENFAGEVNEFLVAEYADIPRTVTELLDEARALPAVIDDDAVMGTFAKLIKRFRDTTARVEAFRIKEAEPYLRGKQAVDSFFFGLKDKCARRDSKAKPGAADILQSRLDDYNQRKLRVEQERLRLVAAEEARLAREAQEKAASEARAAEAARLAAERARKPEAIEQKVAVADAAEGQASTSKIEAGLATERAQDAHIATLAKPADLVRTRVEEGPMVTMGTEPYAIIEDDTRLDMAKLWPFISIDAKEKALRSWARTTGHSIPMDGASIGKRPKSIVR